MSKVKTFFEKSGTARKNFLFKNRYGTVMFLTGITIAFWDLILKFLSDGKTLPAIKGFFGIVSTHNTGGAWSIFSNATWALIVISILFLGLLIFFNYKLKRKNYFYAISMGLLLSGALCNLLDRLRFGYVRDFINLEFMKFPVFNIADMAICVGVFLLCVYFIFVVPRLERAEAMEASDDAVDFVENYQISSSTVAQEPAENSNKIAKTKKSSSKSSNKTKQKTSSKKTPKTKTANDAVKNEEEKSSVISDQTTETENDTLPAEPVTLLELQSSSEPENQELHVQQDSQTLEETKQVEDLQAEQENTDKTIQNDQVSEPNFVTTLDTNNASKQNAKKSGNKRRKSGAKGKKTNQK